MFIMQFSGAKNNFLKFHFSQKGILVIFKPQQKITEEWFKCDSIFFPSTQWKGLQNSIYLF